MHARAQNVCVYYNIADDVCVCAREKSLGRAWNDSVHFFFFTHIVHEYIILYALHVRFGFFLFLIETSLYYAIVML
jgi:hypothetical protein